nr:hypothetical protein [Tanacetum cinerariifolium]
MPRSLTKELFTPFKDPKREFRSSRKHFKTLSLDESRSPDFDLFSDQEEYSDEEVAETMAKTMEQYISKTRADYGSGVARPKIEDTDNFELKGQFIKELRDNTFRGSDHEDVNEHIEKFLKIVDLFHIPNITIDQVMLRAFPMSLTRATSRWLRNKPSGSITTWEDLKIKFLRKYCPHARTAKKMEDINNFQQEPDENLYQAWEQFKELLMKCPQPYLTEMQEVVLFYNGLDVPTRQILDSRGAIPSKTDADTKDVNNVKVPITPKIVHLRKKGKPSKKLTILNLVHLFKERDIERLLRGFTKGTMPTLENSNLIKEIRASTDAAIRNQGASIKTLEIQIEQMSKVSYGPPFSKAYSEASHINSSIPRKEKDLGSFTLPCFINNVCFDNALADLGANISVMPLSTYLNLGLGELAHTKLTVELADRTVKYPKGIVENVLVGIDKFVFLVEIDVFKRKINLRVGGRENNFQIIKPDSSLIKRVYMLSLRERMDLDLEARLMGETLVLNRSLDPFFGDYKELNDLNVTLELRRDQIDDVMPTIKEGEVVEDFRARNDTRKISKIFEYPSDYDHDKKIRIGCAYNLKKDKLEYKGNNEVGALMNIPIFVGTFSILAYFSILEDMDAYRDEGLGDVIFGESFLREVGIKAR